jgi:phosphate starvation-inducible PhoH-like protein
MRDRRSLFRPIDARDFGCAWSSAHADRPLKSRRSRSCRTLTRSCILLDEAQNATSMQMKMFLTRLGEGSRMIVTGDPSQTDLPPGQKSGLSEAVNLLANLDVVGRVRFSEGDVVRHDLVRQIVGAYERAARANKQTRGEP